jgi:hypothetical protein
MSKNSLDDARASYKGLVDTSRGCTSKDATGPFQRNAEDRPDEAGAQ